MKNEDDRLYVGLPDHEPPLPVDSAPPPVPDRPGLVVAPRDAVLFHDPEAESDGTLDVPEDWAVPREVDEPDVIVAGPEERPEAVEDVSAEPVSDVTFGNRVVVALKAEVPDVV